ncbi:methylated-DNA--[protein]-cysteine S-methyltransferase [Oceanibacterium hippocampi]|uniref:Methylated-DNA--protein-cysteine methyltransferase n=1 Tax=Oceanibacterium hippocampi TaxID=745714 RepID=A0A1Y5RM44_9PROT|nr:methylated-DNA--[protein]-cysteine S-methyltransferase [Oceanibacterium hippocampi]SLN20550.1 Methylated-DNA--protein-cysteine methyltransferase [Oceanibacterium hippocampi]
MGENHAVRQRTVMSPLGPLTITEEDAHIVALDWGSGPPECQADTPLLTRAAAQINAYFDNVIKNFSLPLKPAGTAFQRAVWAAMLEIPPGRTETYGSLAARIDGIARAVGTACGANPIPIIIPCHRVVAAKHLGGYSGDGGLDTKRYLLTLEGCADFSDQPTLI